LGFWKLLLVVAPSTFGDFEELFWPLEDVYFLADFRLVFLLAFFVTGACMIFAALGVEVVVQPHRPFARAHD